MQPRDLLKDGSEYPLLAAARTYLERRNPLLIGDFVEKLQSLLRACGAFGAGLLALYGYFRTKRGRRPEFFLEEIGAIERLARESSAPGGGNSIPRATRFARSQPISRRSPQPAQTASDPGIRAR